MRCRRCRKAIPEGHRAHLVRSGASIVSKYRLFDDVVTAHIVCDDCLLPKEVGFRDTEPEWEPYPEPPVERTFHSPADEWSTPHRPA